MQNYCSFIKKKKSEKTILQFAFGRELGTGCVILFLMVCFMLIRIITIYNVDLVEFDYSKQN